MQNKSSEKVSFRIGKVEKEFTEETPVAIGTVGSCPFPWIHVGSCRKAVVKMQFIKNHHWLWFKRIYRLRTSARCRKGLHPAHFGLYACWRNMYRLISLEKKHICRNMNTFAIARTSKTPLRMKIWRVFVFLYWPFLIGFIPSALQTLY